MSFQGLDFGLLVDCAALITTGRFISQNKSKRCPGRKQRLRNRKAKAALAASQRKAQKAKRREEKRELKRERKRLRVDAIKKARRLDSGLLSELNDLRGLRKEVHSFMAALKEDLDLHRMLSGEKRRDFGPILLKLYDSLPERQPRVAKRRIISRDEFYSGLVGKLNASMFAASLVFRWVFTKKGHTRAFVNVDDPSVFFDLGFCVRAKAAYWERKLESPSDVQLLLSQLSTWVKHWSIPCEADLPKVFEVAQLLIPEVKDKKARVLDGWLRSYRLSSTYVEPKSPLVLSTTNLNISSSGRVDEPAVQSSQTPGPKLVGSAIPAAKSRQAVRGFWQERKLRQKESSNRRVKAQTSPKSGPLVHVPADTEALLPRVARAVSGESAGRANQRMGSGMGGGTGQSSSRHSGSLEKASNDRRERRKLRVGSAGLGVWEQAIAKQMYVTAILNPGSCKIQVQPSGSAARTYKEVLKGI
jgi:hypothetical protein